MAVAATPPKGGIVAQLGSRSYPLLLRNEEIERFETQHAVGIYGILDQFIGRGEAPQARHVRDLVSLGLIGGGMPDRAADSIVHGLGPSHNLELRQVAHDLILIAFLPEKPEKKSVEAGSDRKKRAKPTSGTSPSESEASPEQVSNPKKSGK